MLWLKLVCIFINLKLCIITPQIKVEYIIYINTSKVVLEIIYYCENKMRIQINYKKMFDKTILENFSFSVFLCNANINYKMNYYKKQNN